MLTSELVITARSMVQLVVRQGFSTFPFIEKQPGIPILAIAGIDEYQHRVLLLLRIPPNIRRTHLLGKEVSAGLDPNWSDSDTYYITFSLSIFNGSRIYWKRIFPGTSSLPQDCFYYNPLK